MSVTLEKAPATSPHEYSHESLASPGVLADIEKITAIEREIADRSGIAPDTMESVRATDAFLVANAERPESSADDMEAALVAGALEATNQRIVNADNPIMILELDGYGAQINDVVKELHDSYATLPDGESAALVLAQELDKIVLDHALTHDVNVVPQRQASSGIPEFDRLDDYTPEFSGQLLMHRSNAELKPGDVVLPSDQISAEMHKQLNGGRSFNSSSSTHGSGEYDKRLAHAGTRDFGAIYGKYLYVVEPLEDDTLKWGENPGSDVDRTQKAKSPAIDRLDGRIATTDSHTEKLVNEVVSTVGFRVVERISHEPAYSDALLPWPVSRDSVQRHAERRDNSKYTVEHDEGHTVSGFIKTTSRKSPGKMGPVDMWGTYRAGAGDQIAANLQTKFDVRKQHSENPGQLTLPKMPIANFRVQATEQAMGLRQQDYLDSRPEEDALPGMENMTPPRPPMM